MVDWSQLPSEIIAKILEKLSVPDQLRSRCIRGSWNAAFRAGLYRPSPHFPWLMIRGDTNTSAKFFSLSENRVYSIRLPPPKIRRRCCVGSSFGWLITADDQADLHLLHPLSGVQVRLPSIATLPGIDSFADFQGRTVKFTVVESPGHRRTLTPDKMSRFFFKKAVLSSAPDADGGGDYIILLIHGPKHSLAFSRSRDKRWTSLMGDHALSVSDVISFQGRIFTVDLYGGVSAWRRRDRVSLTYIESTVFRKGPEGIGDEHYRKYLVMLPGGELLLVLRRRSLSDIECSTIYFRIFLFDGARGSWSLFVLFVGNNHFMYFDTSDFPEMKPNCVYFTDDDLSSSFRSQNEQGDAGVFDMTDSSITSLHSLCPHLKWPPPIWVTPTLLQTGVSHVHLHAANQATHDDMMAQENISRTWS